MRKLTKNDASKIVVDFQRVGPNKIDVDEAIKQWSRLWGLYQWKDEYRVIKSLRKDSQISVLKITLHKEQALELIEKLQLKPFNGTCFKNAMTWRRMQDWAFLSDYVEQRRLQRIK